MILKAIFAYIILWSVFGNNEDGLWGQRGGRPDWHGKSFSIGRFVTWWIRNPAHNLCWHVLKWQGGPFYNGKSFYIGWRPDNGALGMARHRWGE